MKRLRYGSIWRGGATWVLFLAAGALLSKYSATHGDPRNWGRIANGEHGFVCLGTGAFAGAAALLAWMVATSAGLARVDWLLPVRKRWARYLLLSIAGMLALLSVGGFLALFAVVY